MSWGNSRAQAMEEHDLEEGEACYHYNKYDDDTSIDPDIALSYIDEKIQSVLGHFQKDFEGGVSAENLGTKFGGYGSFLPTYQRSPSILPHPRTPQRSQNQGTSRSCSHLASEGPPQNSTSVSDPLSTRRSGTAASRGGHTLHDSRVPRGGDSTRQDSCFSAQESNKFPAKHEVSMIKSLNPTDQRPLKLRIRVGSDKTAQKSTALHTSLGLISPSSSMENSPAESGEMLAKFQEIYSDSPASILQTMTSFPVAGSVLLSPLHEKLLTLSRNEKLFSENEHVAAAKDTNPQSVMSANSSTSRLEDGDVLIRKKSKSVGKSEYVEELNSEVRNDTMPLFQRNSGIKSLKNSHCFSNDLNHKVVPDLVCETHESGQGAGGASEAMKDSEKEVPMKKREINRLKDQLFGSDLDKDDSLESLSDLSGYKCDHQEVRSRSVELQLESFQKNASFDSKEDGRSKCSRSVPSLRADADISESEKDSSGAVSLRKKAVMKAASHKLDQPKIPHTEKQSSEGKKKLTENLPGLKPAADAAEVKGVSTILKNKKNSMKDVRVAHVFDAQLEKPTNQLARPATDKLKKSKLEARKGQHSSSSKSRQVPSKKADSHVASATPMEDPSAVGLQGTKELTSGAEPPVAPVVIEEDWVACDKCEKWRLLPYGTKPEQLPERWMCSMLYWLPGMNRCDISEEETTRALHALYQMPLPDSLNTLQNHAGRSASGVISTDMHGLGGNSENAGFDYMVNGGKKKHKLRETPKTSSNRGPMLTTNSHLQHELVKSRSLKNVSQPVAESNSVSKSSAQIPVKSSDVLGKHRNKLKEHMVNGDEKPKKKAKRELNQYDCRDLKNLKIKSDRAFVATREVVTGTQHYRERGNLKEIKPGLTERLQILEKKHGNRVQDSRDSGSNDIKTNIGRGISVKKRKVRDQDYLMNSQSNGNLLGDSDGNVNVGEVSGESGFRKQKKSKVLHSVKKEPSTSKGEEKSSGTRGAVTRIVLPGTRDFPIDRSVEKEHQSKKNRVKGQSRLTMEDIDSLKKDLGSEQFSMAATSSSSKVSDSRKHRANHQVKGSPVGSVSSSPMRMFITSKTSPARMDSPGKDDAKLDNIGSPRKYLGRDGDFESDKSTILMKGKTPGVPHPEVYENSELDFWGTNAREIIESRVIHASELGNSHMCNNVDVLEQCSSYMTEKHATYCSDGKGRVSKKHVSVSNEHKSAKDPPLQFKEKDWNANFITPRVEENISDQLGSKEVLISKIDQSDLDSSAKSFKNNQKVSQKDPPHCSDSRREHRLKHDGVGSTTKLNSVCNLEGKVLTKQKPHQEIDARLARNGRSIQTESMDLRSQVGAHAEDKLGTSVIKSKPASGSQKGSFKDVGMANASVSARVSTMLKDPDSGVCQNASQNNMGHLEPDHYAVPEPTASTPSKREFSSQTAFSILREAEGLRGVADRLKNSGFHAEYNNGYFQAALRFLQGALLLESSNGESSKSGETNPVQIYSNTAKLCETCALEYEKHGETAIAALAYKCMEVAYMRVLYCKSMSSSRIWHDLQANLQVPPQGESPSSSASDVDNTNNQTVAEKTALSRGSGSHAGNHVIAPRNRPSLVRLLEFTKDVNSAMEASRKAQNAFAAATNVEKAENKDAFFSVKRVIDFSFQDVEELIRLVKQAIEAINHNGFGGSRG